MDLTPQDKDKLLLFTAGLLAERRKERGIKLNYPEAMAYLSCAMLEGAREGRDPDALVAACGALLTSSDLMDGVAEMITEVSVEATFPDGVRLIRLRNPITTDAG